MPDVSHSGMVVGIGKDRQGPTWLDLGIMLYNSGKDIWYNGEP